MAPWFPYLILAIFPLALFAQVNPVRFSWGYHHYSEPMPRNIQEDAERIDRYTWPLRDGLIVVLVVIIMRHEHILPTTLGLRLNGWPTNAAIGILSGLSLIGVRVLILRLLPRVKEGFNDHGLSKGSAFVWGLAFLIGAFSQELWIAFCIVALRQTHHSVTSSLAVTGIVFGVVHYPYRLGAIATACLGITSGMLFLWRGSLLPSYLFHLIGNFGAAYWVRRTAPRSS